MNGMIFAAGLGTRLRPLTNDRPKALVELGGKPLLEWVIRKMVRAGVDRVVVNVHHYAGQIEDFLKSRKDWGCEVIVSDEREELLDTGGGLLKAAGLFNPEQPVLIHNVDIFAEVDLGELIKNHVEQKNYVTLVTRPSAGGRVLRFNKKGILKGWENQLTGERKIVDKAFYDCDAYSFCGIQVVSPDFLQHMLFRGVFSIVDEYLAQAGHRDIKMWYYEGKFADLGTPEALKEVETWLQANKE